MRLRGKPVGSLIQEDLEALIANGVAESQLLEYKSELPGGSDRDKKDFLADVSAFANSAGGCLLYGVETQRDAEQRDTGIPLHLRGSKPANWPAIPTGALLTDPATAARTFFSQYNPFSQYMAYNTYLSSAPPPPPGGPLAVSIQGPDHVYSSVQNTYRASLSGGSPPYVTYKWSFGTPHRLDPASVDVKYAATQKGNQAIYFDVWDAAGNHVAVSKSVFVTDPTGGCGGTRLTC